MCANAGINSYAVLKNSGGDYGYNFMTDRFENLFAAGIIDPVKVVRIALEQAASVAGTMLTSSVMMVEENIEPQNS